MKVGDLVRMNPNAANRVGQPEAAEAGLVMTVESAWPNASPDPKETALSVSVSYSDGREKTWYDWQLEVISESR